MGHHQPPLVLSLSQIQSGGGLLIVNPHGNEQQAAPQAQAPPHQGPLMNGLTPLPPTAATPDVNGHLVHSTSSTRSDTSSNSPLDTSGGVNVGATSPVSSAVRIFKVRLAKVTTLDWSFCVFHRYDLLQTCLTLVWM